MLNRIGDVANKISWRAFMFFGAALLGVGCLLASALLYSNQKAFSNQISNEQYNLLGVNDFDYIYYPNVPSSRMISHGHARKLRRDPHYKQKRRRNINRRFHQNFRNELFLDDRDFYLGSQSRKSSYGGDDHYTDDGLFGQDEGEEELFCWTPNKPPKGNGGDKLKNILEDGNGHTVSMKITLPDELPEKREWILNLGQTDSRAEHWTIKKDKIRFGEWDGIQVDFSGDYHDTSRSLNVILTCTYEQNTEKYCCYLDSNELGCVDGVNFDYKSYEYRIGVKPSKRDNDRDYNSGAINGVSVRGGVHAPTDTPGFGYPCGCEMESIKTSHGVLAFMANYDTRDCFSKLDDVKDASEILLSTIRVADVLLEEPDDATELPGAAKDLFEKYFTVTDALGKKICEIGQVVGC